MIFPPLLSGPFFPRFLQDLAGRLAYEIKETPPHRYGSKTAFLFDIWNPIFL